MACKVSLGLGRGSFFLNPDPCKMIKFDEHFFSDGLNTPTRIVR